MLPEQQTALFKENIHALLKKEDVTSADRVALMSSILPQYANQAIPKHFIYVWTGKAIKPEYLEEIRSVAINSRAMGFRVLLYVTDPNLFLATQEQLSNSAKIPNLHIHNIQELTDFALDYFRDPNDFQNQALGVLLLDYLEREHIGLHNYGSYSDIIRLLALLKHGGYYLDTDTFITKQNTAKSEGASFFTRGEFKAQPSRLGLLYYFDERKAGNNVIASLQNHPIVCLNLLYIVKQYLEASDRQYYSQITTFNLKDGRSYSLALALSKADLKRAPYNGKFNDKRGRVQLTINMTGPGSLSTSSEIFLINQLEHIITQNGLEIDLAKGKLSDLHRLERLQYLNDNFYKHSDSPDLFAIEMARPSVFKLGELEVHFEGAWYKKPSFQSFEC